MALTSGTKLGPYEILSPLGAGGMGEVYRARDTKLSRETALKVLPEAFAKDAERMARFEREAQVLASLNHPNIAAIYGLEESGGVRALVMELVEGPTLAERLKSGAIPLDDALPIAKQIAEALEYAHEKGIIHRDLKPENVFISRDGHVKILDFGLAKLSQPVEPSGSLTALPTTPPVTEPGMVLGTVGYMSPEQVRGQLADHRSDIFSFGLILYEMLAGRAAFRRETGAETLTAILKEDPPELSAPGISPAVERVVDYCLEKDPPGRFQSARDLAFALEALSGGSGATSAVQAVIPETRKKPGLASIAAAAAAVLLIAAAYVIGLKRAAAPPAASFQALTFRRGMVSSARFLSDGETVVYSAAWDGHPSELFTSRIGSPEWRSMGLENAQLLSVSSQGEMAVLLDCYKTGPWRTAGTLARVPVAGGAPRPILENVEYADWSPKGDDLAVARETGGRYVLEFPVGKALYETTGWVSHLRFSPKGDRIAFLDHPLSQDDRGAVAVIDLAGKKRMLSKVYASTQGLAWSPAGDALWFTATEVGNNLAVHRVTLAGRDRVVEEAPGTLTIHDVYKDGRMLVASRSARRGIVGLVPGASEERDLSWLDWSNIRDISADGKTILFDEQGGGAGDKYGVFLRKTDGSPAVRLGDGYGGGLSADGKWALSLDFYSSPAHFVLLPTGAGQTRVIPSSGMNYDWGYWLPDGQRLLVRGARPGEAPALFVQRVDSSELRRVSRETKSAGDLGYLAISPDGKIVAAVGPDRRIALYPIESGEPRSIPGAEPGGIPIAWSADGRQLFVRGVREIPASIYRLDIATGRKTLWKNLMPSDSTGILTLGLIVITPDGKYYAYSFIRDLDTLNLLTGLPAAK